MLQTLSRLLHLRFNSWNVGKNLWSFSLFSSYYFPRNGSLVLTSQWHLCVNCFTSLESFKCRFFHRTVWAPKNVKLGIFGHTVAVQWRNVQKSAMHKQCRCFANLNLSLFCLSSWSCRRLCCSSSYQRRRRWQLQHWKRHLKKSEFRAVLNFIAFIHRWIFQFW